MRSLIALIITCCCLRASAQTEAYKRFLTLIKNQGEVLVADKKLYLAKGETGSANWKVSYLEEYTVYCWGDDQDVTDADIYVYDNNGKVIVKDTETEILAIAHFEVDDDATIKVVGKNSGSSSPSYRAPFYIMLCKKKD